MGVTYVHERLHAQLYGEGVEPEEILGGRVAVPPELLPLYRDIEERASEARVRSMATECGHGEKGGHSSWCALPGQHRCRCTKARNALAHVGPWCRRPCCLRLSRTRPPNACVFPACLQVIRHTVSKYELARQQSVRTPHAATLTTRR